MTERGGPFATGGFAFLVSRAGTKAGLPFKAHPHMLRHAAGYKLANDGHDTRTLQAYLGHRNIQHTGPLHGTGQQPVRQFLALKG